MPISLRSVKNKVIDLPVDIPFLELKDESGGLALLIHVSDGNIELLEPTDKKFKAYCQSFSLETSKLHRIDGM